MPEQHGKAGEKKEDWLKIELFAPMEMIDALTNFLTEIGAQGAFQESLEPQSPNDFPETASGETLKAFLPCDVRLEQRLAALQTYIDSLAEIFPELEKPGFRTEVIRDPDWGEAWKKYFKPLRVSRNIVIKPTWERFYPDRPGHRHRDRPRHGLRHRPARLHADVPGGDRGDPPQGPDLREMARPGRRDGNGHPRHRLRETGRRDRSSAWTSTRRRRRSPRKTS